MRAGAACVGHLRDGQHASHAVNHPRRHRRAAQLQPVLRPARILGVARAKHLRAAAEADDACGMPALLAADVRSCPAPHPASTRLGRQRAQGGVRKLGGRQQQRHVAVVAVRAGRLVEQEVEEAVHARRALKHQQRLRAIQRHRRLRTPAGAGAARARQAACGVACAAATPDTRCAAHLVRLQRAALRLARQQRRSKPQCQAVQQSAHAARGAREQRVQTGAAAHTRGAEKRGKGPLAALRGVQRTRYGSVS